MCHYHGQCIVLEDIASDCGHTIVVIAIEDYIRNLGYSQ